MKIKLSIGQRLLALAVVGLLLVGVGSSTISGSGLGLAMVKQIVVLHQGSVEVESQVNIGTTFRVWLPLANGNTPHS